MRVSILLRPRQPGTKEDMTAYAGCNGVGEVDCSLRKRCRARVSARRARGLRLGPGPTMLPATPSGAPANPVAARAPAEVVRAFWVALAEREPARCLGPADAGQVYRHYFVDFIVGGKAVGSLTHLRCLGATCTAAGTDN